MSFTTPPTFSSGAVLTAAQLNTLSDDISYLYGVAVTNPPWHGAKAQRITTQSINDSTLTAVQLTSSTPYDTDSFFDGTSTMTIPSGIVAGGKTAAIQAVGFAWWATNAAGYREITIYKNGSSGAASTITVGAAVTPGHVVTDSGTAVGGDTFQLKAYQNSGGALNIGAAYFTMIILGIQ